MLTDRLRPESFFVCYDLLLNSRLTKLGITYSELLNDEVHTSPIRITGRLRTSAFFVNILYKGEYISYYHNNIQTNKL